MIHPAFITKMFQNQVVGLSNEMQHILIIEDIWILDEHIDG